MPELESKGSLVDSGSKKGDGSDGVDGGEMDKEKKGSSTAPPGDGGVPTASSPAGGIGAWIVAHSEGIGLVARTVSVCVLLLMFVVPLGVLSWVTVSSRYFAQHSELLIGFGGAVAKNPLSESEVLKLLLGFVTAAAALRGKNRANAPEIVASMSVWGILTIALVLAFVEHYAVHWGFTSQSAADYSDDLRVALLAYTEGLRRDLLLLFGVLLGLRSVPSNEQS